MKAGGEIARNIASLLAGGVLGKILRFLATIHAANALGAGSFGILSAAFGTAIVIANGADFGLCQLGVRKLSRCGEGTDGLALDLVLMKAALVTAASALALVAAYVIPLDSATRTLAIVAVLLIPSNEIVFEWLFEGLGRVALSGVYRAVMNALFLGGVLYFVETPEDILRVIYVDAAASLTAVTVCVILWPGLWKCLRGPVRLSNWWELLRGALPFGVANLLVMSLSYVGVFALISLVTAEDAGLYRAAAQLVFGITSIGFLVSRAVYPVLSRLAHEESGILERTMAPVFRLIFAGAVPAGVGLALIASPTVALIYEPEFAPSSSALAILAASMPLGLATISCHYALLAYGKPGTRVAGLAIQIVLELALDAFLIQKHGCKGAAIAQVVAQAVSLAFAYAMLLRIERVTMFRHAMVPAVSCIPMAGATLATLGHGVFVGITAGVAAYGVTYLFVSWIVRRIVPDKTPASSIDPR